ncbi:MAG TPA: ribose-phosphate diphosphokinase [Gemmatimonadaceae bacterium]
MTMPIAGAATTAERTPAATLLTGSANRPLAEAIGRELGLSLGACTIGRFPDGEVMVRLEESIRGRQVVVVQPTSPPVDQHLMELLALTDACQRAAAARVIAVVPYFGYARSDRREGRRTPVMASLVADLMRTAGIGELVLLDVHASAVEGFFRGPVDAITAVPVLAAALKPRLPRDAVIVAPDLGATRLASRYAEHLQCAAAVCHKQRSGPDEVAVRRITGDVEGRPCLIVDDMITTGATIVESVRALGEAGALPGIMVAATHAVLAPGALAAIAASGVRELVVTDSIAPREAPPDTLRCEVVTVAPLLALAVRRLLEGGSLRELA